MPALKFLLTDTIIDSIYGDLEVDDFQEASLAAIFRSVVPAPRTCLERLWLQDDGCFAQLWRRDHRKPCVETFGCAFSFGGGVVNSLRGVQFELSWFAFAPGSKEPASASSSARA